MYVATEQQPMLLALLQLARERLPSACVLYSRLNATVAGGRRPPGSPCGARRVWRKGQPHPQQQCGSHHPDWGDAGASARSVSADVEMTLQVIGGISFALPTAAPTLTRTLTQATDGIVGTYGSTLSELLGAHAGVTAPGVAHGGLCLHMARQACRGCHSVAWWWEAGRARRQGRAVLAAGPWQVRLLLVHPTKETRDEYRAATWASRGGQRRSALLDECVEARERYPLPAFESKRTGCGMNASSGRVERCDECSS